jgi:pimeloyl-ACP methyl ester carboxylesterase
MPRFTSFDGVEIAYQEWGTGADASATSATPAAQLPPVVLHHGFIADANLNWVGPGVVAALLRAGRRVVALDARGHGASGKPHDPGVYGEEKMAADLRRLFDLTSGEGQVDLVGYSMGAVVSLLTASQDARVRRLVVGGVGGGLAEQSGLSSRAGARGAIAAALRASDAASIQDPVAVRFRALADRVGYGATEREALAACAEAAFTSTIAFEQISAPTLVLVGDADPIAARPEVLAGAIPRAQLRVIAGDHLSAVLNPEFAAAIVEFVGVA